MILLARGVFLKKNGEKYYPAPYMPIGSIYLTVSNDNPSKWFGGTWEKMSGGYLYACVNSIGNSSYTGISTQGHALTQGQLPKVTGHIEFTPVDGFNCYGCFTNYGSSSQKVSAARNSLQTTWGADLSFGNNEAHSHNIAYIGVWCWKRIA